VLGAAELSVLVLWGDGGVGKTRLASELALELRDEYGWMAGYGNAAQLWSDQHTLVVLDYLEERLDEVRKVLKTLGSLAEPGFILK